MTRTQNPRRTALIIGCGIGGPVAAMALQKVGIDATVFEAHEGNAEFVGSFLNTASNGLDALKAIDAHHEVLAHGFPTPRMVMWSGSGKRLGEVANGLRLPDGTVSITVERGHLHGALRREALDRGIRIEEGKRLVSAAPSDGGVTARFADGTEAHGDLLIGADGIHSRTRQLVDPAAPAPRYTGQLSLGGRARADDACADSGDLSHDLRAARILRLLRARTGRRLLVREHGMGRRDDAARASERSPRCSGSDSCLLSSRTMQGRRATSSVRPPTSSPPSPSMTCPSCRRGTAIRWSSSATPPTRRRQARARGRRWPSKMPSSSRSVSATAMTSRTALAAYERLRRRRVERVVAYSARVGQSKTLGTVGRWVRDLMMPVALKLFASPNAQAWLYGYHIDWTRTRRLTEVGVESRGRSVSSWLWRAVLRKSDMGYSRPSR